MGGTEQLPITNKQILHLAQDGIVDGQSPTDDAYGIIFLMNKNHKDYQL